jgi:hypothetical protein
MFRVENPTDLLVQETVFNAKYMVTAKGFVDVPTREIADALVTESGGKLVITMEGKQARYFVSHDAPVPLTVSCGGVNIIIPVGEQLELDSKKAAESVLNDYNNTLHPHGYKLVMTSVDDETLEENFPQEETTSSEMVSSLDEEVTPTEEVESDWKGPRGKGRK